MQKHLKRTWKILVVFFFVRKVYIKTELNQMIWFESKIWSMSYFEYIMKHTRTYTVYKSNTIFISIASFLLESYYNSFVQDN